MENRNRETDKILTNLRDSLSIYRSEYNDIMYFFLNFSVLFFSAEHSAIQNINIANVTLFTSSATELS